MRLQDYKKKRSFDTTPEPTGGRSRGRSLRFVVQKHAASQLHYDFRLEMAGVLKSWAVPKGPSLDPSIKRLAMLVEDHPFDYRNFEGTIPEGNYGAGTVIIWDQGRYEPQESVSGKPAQEKILLKAFEAGTLKFRLFGEKLKGEFVLVRTPKRASNAWMLIKHRDEYAAKADVGKLDRSVVSGKTIEELADVEGSGQGDTSAPSKRKSAPGKRKKGKQD